MWTCDKKKVKNNDDGHTVGFIKNSTPFFCELLCLQLAKFEWFLAKLGQFKENEIVLF